MVGLGGENIPIGGLFKYPWLSLGTSLTGRSGVRTGGLRVSMRFMGPEEGRVVAVKPTPRPSLADVFAAEDGGKGEGGGKGGYSDT
jgi:hypothetical protein